MTSSGNQDRELIQGFLSGSWRDRPIIRTMAQQRMIKTGNRCLDRFGGVEHDPLI
jgi:hypothetical protein